MLKKYFTVSSFLRLFHKHSVVTTSRKLIKREFVLVSQEVEHFNIYLNKGYCIKCKQRLAWKSSILESFDIKQPYDKG